VASAIDLNVDLGAPSARDHPDDVGALDVATSVNIVCSVSPGAPSAIRKAVRNAVAKGIAIGARPEYPDASAAERHGGHSPADDLFAYVVYHVGALRAICAAEGGRLRYVKPGGSLSRWTMRDTNAADAVAHAVYSVDPSIALVGLAGSELLQGAKRAGLRVVREAFIDRGYRADGTLVAREQPHATLHDDAVIAERALRMVRDHHVEAVDGTLIHVYPDTLSIDAGSATAAPILRTVRTRLEQAGIRIAPWATA